MPPQCTPEVRQGSILVSALGEIEIEDLTFLINRGPKISRLPRNPDPLLFEMPTVLAHPANLLAPAAQHHIAFTAPSGAQRLFRRVFDRGSCDAPAHRGARPSMDAKRDPKTITCGEAD